MFLYIIYYNRFVSTVDRLSRPCIPTIYMAYNIYIQLISRSWEAAKSKQNECIGNKRSGACHIIFQYNRYYNYYAHLYRYRYRASVQKLTSKIKRVISRTFIYIIPNIYLQWYYSILFFSRTSSTNMTRLLRHYSLSAVIYIWSPRFRSVL